MNQYWIEVTADIPYPIQETFRVKASGIATAINRGVRDYRKFIQNLRGKKKITALRIKAMKI